MRSSWLYLALAAKTLAAPAADFADVGIEPNGIDILGGDFGLVNNAVSVEWWNGISTMLSSMAGSADPQAKLKGTIAGLGMLGKTWENIASSFGEELVRWLGDQFQVWMVGTGSSDATDVICSLYEHPEVMLSGFLSSVGPPSRKQDKCGRTSDGGSGPYKANYSADPTFGFRTVYAPIKPPDFHMPVIAWAGCISSGTLFVNFLTELASHGYLVVTTGPPDEIAGSTLVSDTTRNIDWAVSKAARKFGYIDTSKVIVAGHSCGGLEALSASYKDPRVKLTMLFDSGISDASKRVKLAELKAPVAYFYGGSGDRAFKDVSRQKPLPSSIDSKLF
jgi:hypothetical protein